jgi:hypothetical protein
VEQDAPTDVAALAVSFNAMAAHLDLADERRKQFTADVAHELRSPGRTSATTSTPWRTASCRSTRPSWPR